MKKIITILILFAIPPVLFAVKAVRLLTDISGPEKYIEQDFDVISYDAELDFSLFPSTEMRGICRMAIRWNSSPIDNTFYFHLRGLTIDSVFYQNIKVEITEAGSIEDPRYHYELVPPPQLSADSATVTVFYHGNMTLEYNDQWMKWGGVQSRNGVLFAMGVGFYNNYVSSTQHWLACYDHPSDKASFKCKYIVPEGIFVASNGLLIEEQYNVDGKNIFLWEHKNDCATYNYTFAASDYTKVEFSDSKLPLVVYCKPKDTTRTKYNFKLLPQMLDAYESKFGKYPFEKVGYVLTPTGSMEHETMISFNEKLVSGRMDTINEIAAHELSHQWFGDMVTPYDFREAWLNEGFATFCESIWYEYLFGFEGYLIHQEKQRNRYISFNGTARSEGIFSLFDFPRTPPSSNYPGTIYQKGGAVVGMLRYELGDSLFFEAMKEYLSSNKYGNVTTEILKDVCEDFAGRNLTWFFDQWIYGRGWPQLKISLENITDKSGQFKCTVSFEQVQADSMGSYVNLPVEIGFEDSSGVMLYHTFVLNSREEVFYLDLGFECKDFTVNKGPTLRTLMEVKEAKFVGVREDILTDKIKIYPNPSDSKIMVEFIAGEGFTNITLMNEVGQEVLNKKLVTKKGENIFNIDSNNFASGNYFIIINYNGIIQREKICITH
jgi:aminopeptidase N